jgi:hypothetical protein
VGDAIAAIIEGFVALLQLIAEAIAFLVQGSVTVVGYLLFPAYRDRKNLEWCDRPVRKALALGFSGLCLATLSGLGLWLLISAYREARAPAETPPAANRGSNFVRACLKRVEQATSLCLGRNLLPKSGGLVARQDGQVARSTPFQTGSQFRLAAHQRGRLESIRSDFD